MSVNSEAIISIKPQYAMAILSGEKTVELRRRIPPIEDGSRLWIYATRPTAAIIGSAILRRVVSQAPNELWALCKGNVAIDRSAYDSYFEGASEALGLYLSEVQQITPIHIDQLRNSFDGFHPPQVMVRLCQARRTSLSNLINAA